MMPPNICRYIDIKKLLNTKLSILIFNVPRLLSWARKVVEWRVILTHEFPKVLLHRRQSASSKGSSLLTLSVSSRLSYILITSSHAGPLDGSVANHLN
jgi:hypothetical protein